MQIVSYGNNLFEMSEPIFWKKYMIYSINTIIKCDNISASLSFLNWIKN